MDVKNIEDKVIEVLSTNENIIEAKVDSSEINGDELTINVSIKPKATLKTTEVTIEKPEGMSDEQFEVMIKHLQKEIEEQSIHDYEFTN